MSRIKYSKEFSEQLSHTIQKITVDSYIDRLNSVASTLDIDISDITLSSTEQLENIVGLLVKRNSYATNTITSYKTALYTYLDFIKNSMYIHPGSSAANNKVYPFKFSLVPVAGADANPPSVPFRDIGPQEAKAGKITDRSNRCLAYLALYTFLADENQRLPMVGDKSVLATLIHYGDIEITTDNNFRLVKPYNIALDAPIPYNDDWHVRIIKNPLYHNNNETNLIPKIFATRVWGFNPKAWPIITFGLEGNRDLLIKNSQAGDYIIFVGTLNEPTAEDERGAILGIARIGRIAVNTLDILTDVGTKPALHDFDEMGQFRWPKALLMTQAWAFPSKPKLKDIFTRQLPYNATIQAVELSAEEAELIMQLPAQEIDIPKTKVTNDLQLLEQALSKGRTTTGPMPSAWSKTVTKTLGNRSVTYAMRFGKSNCWKIGHTINSADREIEINKHIPYELLEQKWKTVYTQSWQDEVSAWQMEQRVFKALEKERTEGERVICSEECLRSAWVKAISSAA